MKPLVIQTENLPEECSDWLAKRCDLHMCPADSLRFKELLPQAEGLVIRTYTKVDAEMIRTAQKLKVVGRAGAGVDNIDIDACKAGGITVVHTPEANSESVVEFVITTMLASLRTTTPVTCGLGQLEWNTLREASLTKQEFTETTIGIVGFGRIGSRLGKMTKTMGFRVVFHDVLQIEETHGCEQVPMKDLLHSSDIISVHVDGRQENSHLCNKEMFGQMQRHVLFMNASRGFVVDAYALTDFLTHNAAAHAILDVHDPEPITSQYPLLHLPNATLYPHIACKTKTATINMGWVVRDIVAVLQNEKPKHQVTLKNLS